MTRMSSNFEAADPAPVSTWASLCLRDEMQIFWNDDLCLSGKQSSLKGKIQKIIDPKFSKQEPEPNEYHNPNATVIWLVQFY